MPKSAHSSFYTFYTSMGLGRDTYAEKRWYIDTTTPAPLAWKLREGKFIENLPESVFGRAEKANHGEDFPCTSDRIPVANDRARFVLEQVAPGQIQFIPFTIFVNDRPAVDAYYLMNILTVVDCTDQERSRPYRVSEQPLFYTKLFVDEQRVPQTISILRVKDDIQNVYIRSTVRDVLISNKLIGWVCYPA